MRDPRAEFTRAYEESYLDVLRFVRRRVGDDGADDVVADVFTVAWRRWASAPADLRPWLFGIAHKVLAQDRRTRRRRIELQLRVAREPMPSGDETPLSVDAALDLQAAWAQLSDRDREAIALVAWDGLTGAQAAKVLGCTRSTFAVRLSRARRRLRAGLEANGAPRPDRGVAAAGRSLPLTAEPVLQIVEGEPL